MSRCVPSDDAVGKRRPAIAPDDVPDVFNDACILELAALAQLPPSADLNVFAAGVREAAHAYARASRERDANELHHEIAVLYDAARRRQNGRTASLLEELSPQARAYLNDRLKRPGPRKAKLRLPSAGALRNSRRCDTAREMIERVCRVGGVFVEGRERPSGKRSRPTFRARLHAPALQRHVPKRDPERNFVINLQATWLKATGTKPARTARHKDDSREVGPLARVAEKCLQRLDVPGADVAELINELNRRRVEKRRALVCRRQKERAAKRAHRLSNIKS